MMWIELLGLAVVAAVTIYVLRFGPYRHWRRGNKLHTKWERERQQMLDSLQSLQFGQPPEQPRSNQDDVIDGELLDDDPRSSWR